MVAPSIRGAATGRFGRHGVYIRSPAVLVPLCGADTHLPCSLDETHDDRSGSPPVTPIADWLSERSPWQVIGVYLAGSWVVFEGAATVTEALGLPNWLPLGALTLAGAGLPVVAAAAMLRKTDGFLTLRNALVMGLALFVGLFGAASGLPGCCAGSSPLSASSSRPQPHRSLGEALETGDASLVPDGQMRGKAQTLVRLAEYDRALDALEEMVFALPYRIMYEIWDPVLEPLWETARFREVVLPRLNLEGVKVQRGGSDA